MALIDNIIGCWSPSLGATAYRLIDRTKYVNHGTLTNMDAGTDWVAAAVGRVLDFDGSNDKVVLPSRVSFIGARTLLAWIKLTASNVRGGIFGTRNGADGWVLRTSVNSINSIVAGKWHLAAYTYSPGESRLDLYLDGIRIGGSTGYTEATLGTAAWIADEDGTSPFPAGQMAEVSLWSRVLLAPEIFELYRRGNGWIGSELTGRHRRKSYGFVRSGNRRRRLLVGAH